jgi:hypothetical protein
MSRSVGEDFPMRKPYRSEGERRWRSPSSARMQLTLLRVVGEWCDTKPHGIHFVAHTRKAKDISTGI